MCDILDLFRFFKFKKLIIYLFLLIIKKYIIIIIYNKN